MQKYLFITLWLAMVCVTVLLRVWLAKPEPVTFTSVAGQLGAGAADYSAPSDYGPSSDYEEQLRIVNEGR